MSSFDDKSVSHSRWNCKYPIVFTPKYRRMEELSLNKEYIDKFGYMMTELGFEDFNDPYWRSLVFSVSGDDKLFDERPSLVNLDEREINSEKWFSGKLSGGELRLLALTYNLFNAQDL